VEKHLTGTWEEFEAWIRETIGADFHWRVRPQDNATNREMVASFIRVAFRGNKGSFPESNTFIENVDD
jgi:hypothetical protein